MNKQPLTDYEHSHYIPAQRGYRVWAMTSNERSCRTVYFAGRLIAWRLTPFDRSDTLIEPVILDSTLIEPCVIVCDEDGTCEDLMDGPRGSFDDWLRAHDRFVAACDADLARRLYRVPDDRIEQAAVAEGVSS